MFICSETQCRRRRRPPTRPQALVKEFAVARVVVVGGSYAGVELSCNLATELVKGNGRKGKGVSGKVEVTLASGSEVRHSCFVFVLRTVVYVLRQCWNKAQQKKAGLVAFRSRMTPGTCLHGMAVSRKRGGLCKTRFGLSRLLVYRPTCTVNSPPKMMTM